MTGLIQKYVVLVQFVFMYEKLTPEERAHNTLESFAIPLDMVDNC